MLFLFFFVSLRLDDLTNKSERGKEKQRDRREHNHWQNRVRMDCCLSRHVLTLRVSEGAQSSALRREGGREGEREAEESIGGVFNCHWIPCWRDFKKTIHRKGAEMFGKHLADQYAGESWDGVRSLSLFFFFFPSLSRWNTVTFLLLRRTRSTHSAYFCPQINCKLFTVELLGGAGGWVGGSWCSTQNGGLFFFLHEGVFFFYFKYTYSAVSAAGWRNRIKMFLLFLPSLSIPTLRHFMKRQAWHDLRLRFVISHSFVAGQLYSMLPGGERERERRRKVKSWSAQTAVTAFVDVKWCDDNEGSAVWANTGAERLLS